MVNLPLNTFKNVPFDPTTTPQPVYTTPLGITSIVLMAQVSNITSAPTTVSFEHYSFRLAKTTRLVKDMIVPPKDSRILLGGKLVLETGDQIIVSAGGNSSLEFIASLLETANQ